MSATLPPPPPSVPSGWYPDPHGRPGQRYHDGTRWTEHFTPFPPSVVQQPQVVIHNTNTLAAAPPVVIDNRGRVNHVLHLLITLVTCGLWLPIWIILAIAESARRSGSRTAADRAASRSGWTVVAAVFGGLFVLGLIAQAPWVLAFIVPGGLAGGYLLYNRRQQKEQLTEAQKAAVRAEYENKLAAEGDPRGTHGRFPPAGV